uniref:Protein DETOXIFICATION n=1 Tax=Heterosigma akashiwo TaxID=2829 RepID=A0A7S3XUZ4_HETAK|mmetsp:Transcript_8064/g.12584  ORF Transcript_8064/g.12584 Transcript_8064/m.12584 type:complete len:638 (-) Transcript_8064:366-2279(-)
MHNYGQSSHPSKKSLILCLIVFSCLSLFCTAFASLPNRDPIKGGLRIPPLRSTKKGFGQEEQPQVVQAPAVERKGIGGQELQEFLSQEASTVVDNGSSSQNVADVLEIAQEVAGEHQLVPGSKDANGGDLVTLERQRPPSPENPTITLEPIPTTKALIKFVLPTVGMIQAPAIMSMVDAAVVGRLSSLGLAALTPATQMCDAAASMCSSFGMATSNLVATAVAQTDDEELRATVASSLSVAVAVGAAVTAAVQLGGHAYMARLVGPGAAEVLPAALAFARTRILSFTAIMLTMVGQATALGMKDSLTPMLVIVLNACLNLSGDIALVMKMKLGVWGAAVATASSEVVGAVLMVSSVRKMFRANERLGGGLAPAVPKPAWLRKYLGTAFPLFFMLLTRNASFAFLAATVASAGTTALGAYQVLLRVTFILTAFGDGLGVAAQAYLPYYNLRAPLAREARAAKRALVCRIMLLGVAFGGATALAAAGVLLKLPFLFTTDPAVAAEVARTVPTVMGILLAYGVTLPMEGVLVSMRDGAFLAQGYALLLVAKAAYLRLCRRSPALNGNLAVSAWGGLLMYNCLRAALFSGRFLLRDRAEHRALAEREAFKRWFFGAPAPAAAGEGEEGPAAAAAAVAVPGS